jgi:hypothetical protein
MLRVSHCPIVLQLCYPTVPLFQGLTAQQHHCPTVSFPNAPLPFCAIASDSLPYCFAIPLSHYPTVSLRYCLLSFRLPVPLSYCPIASLSQLLTVLQLCSIASLSNCPIVSLLKYHTIPLPHCFFVSIPHCLAVLYWLTVPVFTVL